MTFSGGEIIEKESLICEREPVAGRLISGTGSGSGECGACSSFTENWTNESASALCSLTAGNLRDYSDSLKCILGSHSITSGIVAVGIQPGCLLPVALLG